MVIRPIRQFPDTAGRNNEVLHLRMYKEDIFIRVGAGRNSVLTEASRHGENAGE